MRKLALFLSLVLFIGLETLTAQTKAVSGKVVDNFGESIPGVSIVVKGTTIGTISRPDGTYTLNVPEDAAAIVFTFVGMKMQEVPFTGQSTINVTMELDTEDIDEVVVTALGIKRSQKSIGYASTSVDSEELTKTRSSSIMEGIAGKVAGVQITSSSSDPGASNSVIIRGISSLGGSNQPLYVINGVPMTNNSSSSSSLDGGYDFGNAANLVNPDDVDEVTILKGAAATALYGSRAANGVIIITTKSGEGKTQVTFNSSVEYSDILRLPEFQNDFGMGWDAHHTLNENGSWGPRLDGSERLWGSVYNNSQKLKAFEAQEDNVRDFFDYGKRYNNSITLSGGNETTTYYSSLSMIDQDGLVPTDIDSYRKYTAAFNGSHKMGRLTISSNINYSQQDNNFAQTGQGLTIINSLYQTPRDISIIGLADYENDPFNSVDYYYTPYGITNPYYLINEMEASFEQKKVFGKMQFDVELTDDINLLYRFGLDVSDNVTKIGTPEVQAAEGTPNAGSSTNQEGTVNKGMQRRHQYNHDFLATYSKQFEDLTLDFTGGLNINERNYSSVSASVTGLDIPGFYDLSNSSSTPVVDEYYYKRRIVGLLGNLELGYRNMLFLSLSARNDWSSTLPEDNNSFFYPGATISFLFNEILPDNFKSAISYGKVRMAYGQTGNDADPYVLDPYFNASSIYNPFRNLNFPLAGQNAFEVGNALGNQALAPELSTEFEFGLEMKFFNNRFGFDVAYYDKTSEDQIYSLGLAPSTGYTSQTTNLGEISNKGIELLVEGTPVETKDFSWYLAVNYSKNENELVSLPDELGKKISIGGLSTVGFVAQVGSPIGLYDVTVPKYNDEGQIIVNSGTGRPIAADEKKVIEGADYDFTMGITNTFSYKNVSLSMDLDIREGGLMYSRTADINYFTGNAIQTTYNDRHTFIVPNSVNEIDNGDGTYSYVENTTPISKEDMDDYFADGADKLDETWLVDRSFVKLKRVALTYDMPKKWFETLPITGATLTAYGNNLLLYTPKENTFIDPETTTFGNDLVGKFGEFTANPTTRSWGFNLKLNF
ncbi:SusC/RagA family TonB-linked outer membrane protein [Saccharicrinis sp. 156]|uniref:SusC/RagA family TonB-linked outer membrane protein n=1 Tax=Saccharicrinis sp. 156 TaxID=3417574 RepID=UPI003D32938D